MNSEKKSMQPTATNQPLFPRLESCPAQQVNPEIKNLIVAAQNLLKAIRLCKAPSNITKLQNRSGEKLAVIHPEFEFAVQMILIQNTSCTLHETLFQENDVAYDRFRKFIKLINPKFIPGQNLIATRKDFNELKFIIHMLIRDLKRPVLKAVIHKLSGSTLMSGLKRPLFTNPNCINNLNRKIDLMPLQENVS